MSLQVLKSRSAAIFRKADTRIGEWASFIISIPVMFYGISWNGVLFFLSYRTSIGVRYRNFVVFFGRPGSRASCAARFLRFRGVNLLVSFSLILTA